MSLPQMTKQNVAPRFGRLDADLADVEAAVARSAEYILSRQHAEGYWSGELEADSMLEADYIFLHGCIRNVGSGITSLAGSSMPSFSNSSRARITCGSSSEYPRQRSAMIAFIIAG